MAFVDRIAKIDRRWLFLIMGLLVLEPMLFPIVLPIHVSPPVQGFVDAIDALPEGSTVLMSCDYDPTSIPEMVPMTRTAFRHLMRRNCKVVITCLWDTGAALVDNTVTDVSREFPDKTYGRDWVDLGYKSGREAVMLLMGQGIQNVFPRDYRGTDVHALPLMSHVRDYSSFSLLVNISGGYPGTKEWVQQVESRFHLPMVAGVTAVSAPEFYPYLQSHQLRGMLGGMAGGAEYETARHERGKATQGMAAQSLGHVFVAFCIVLGNVIQFVQRRRS